jgi:magnesium transporter
MLSENDSEQMRIFCESIHPARAAEFLEGLASSEIWEVLRHTDTPNRADIFSYFELDTQTELLEYAPRLEAAGLVDALPADDRVDIIQAMDAEAAEEIIRLLPLEDRRDILRLRAFPEGTCGAEMTSDFVRLHEDMTVEEAIAEIGRQVHTHETVYYLYVLDEGDHLVGLVSAKHLLSAVGKGEIRMYDLMNRDLITVKTMDDRQQAIEMVAKYDFLAIPVVDDERRMLGIITHDDVIDLTSEEATKDAHMMAAISPLEEAYLETPFVTILRKRVFWLSFLFVAGLFTFFAMQHYANTLEELLVLAMFIPLCIATGGNSGSQAATLITRSLALGDIRLGDWYRVLFHEIMMGLALGAALGAIGFIIAYLPPESVRGDVNPWLLAITISMAVASICLLGTIIGSMLPLLFKRIGADPAMASSPFVATFVDVTGIIVFFNIAKFWIL